MPSKGFVVSRIRKYIGQRMRFVLRLDEEYRKFLKDVLDCERPIEVNGIFATVMKDEAKFTFYIRDVLFEQDGKRVIPWRDRNMSKRRLWPFTLDKMVSSAKFVENLRESIPKLGSGD